MTATLQSTHEVHDAPSETLLAIRNALKLGGSLLVTLGIAIPIRVVLPRYLGPSSFGTLSFADAFSTAFFIALSLGVDIYVRKHVAVRPEHASDFFGGAFVLRVLLTALILAVMALVMNWTHRPAEVRVLVYLFAGAQFFINLNATLSALLHAKGQVGGMSVLSIVTKVAWAGGVVAAMLTHGALWEFAAALLATEAVESIVLFVLAQRHLGLVFRVDHVATKVMILASLPYYLANLAMTLYGKLDVMLLTAFATASEVGWYAASAAVANLALLITPLVGWVLMPTFARAAARSREELFERVRSATQLILALVIPVSLFISIGAEIWVRFLFGAAFAPAASAVRILATTFVLMYVGMIYGITLMMLERAWTLTVIAFGGVIVNLLLNVVLIRPMMTFGGDGGGGTGCALSVLGTEIFVTSCMIAVVGRHAFDRRTMSMLGKSFGACAVVVLVDRLMSSFGWSRLVLDALIYVAIVITSGALKIQEIVGVVTTAVREKSQRG